MELLTQHNNNTQILIQQKQIDEHPQPELNNVSGFTSDDIMAYNSQIMEKRKIKESAPSIEITRLIGGQPITIESSSLDESQVEQVAPVQEPVVVKKVEMLEPKVLK